MAGTFVQLPPDSVGKTVATIIDANGNHQQVVQVAADPFGANDLSQMRRTLELVLIEMQTLNAYFLASGLVVSSVQSSETLQTVQ